MPRTASAKTASKNYYARNPHKRLYEDCKHRARKLGLPFDLTVDDFKDVPDRCPVLGIPISFGAGKRTDNSVSIDRIVPSLGYVRSNIRFVSWRCNFLKSNASLNELISVTMYLATNSKFP